MTNFPEILAYFSTHELERNLLIAFIALFAIINYILIVKKIRRNALEREAAAKNERIVRYKEGIQAIKDEQAAQQEQLKLELLQMSEEAFSRYLRQHHYDQQTHLDVAFGKSDNEMFQMLYAIKRQRELNRYRKLLQQLQDNAMQNITTEKLQEIEKNAPHGARFQLLKNPSDLDHLKNQIGTVVHAELKERGAI